MLSCYKKNCFKVQFQTPEMQQIKRETEGKYNATRSFEVGRIFFNPLSYLNCDFWSIKIVKVLSKVDSNHVTATKINILHRAHKHNFSK